MYSRLKTGNIFSKYLHYSFLKSNALRSKQLFIPNCCISNKISLKKGPSLKHFIALTNSKSELIPSEEEEDDIPYIDNQSLDSFGRKVYIETYGCQMNVNDTEIVRSILKTHGYEFTDDMTISDVILLMTCAIREGAEQKIWKKLTNLKYLKKNRPRDRKHVPLTFGILGCMAENLKTKIIEKERMVDLVCGPDAYKDLPRMLAVTESGQKAVNVLLSLDETYGDVTPVRSDMNQLSAYVSIMRGCDNMCTYCIVPYTRGRERSRSMNSILDEVRILSDQGYKEVTLLGQNVNSYRDTSLNTSNGIDITFSSDTSLRSVGDFKTVYKTKTGGIRFADLLDQVSRIDDEMRIRFTSPHPKDFPDAVLSLIKERKNICKQLHMPAQSGSSSVLDAMGRGYTRETYIDLISHVREILPDVSLSSDFISGFCGETDFDHEETLSLIKKIKYNYAFCFPYSMRKKTKAFHRLKDDVPEEVKMSRHHELVNVYRQSTEQLNKSQHGRIQLALVEGRSKRSADDLVGRNDGNVKVVFPNRLDNKIGDYVAIQIDGSSSQVLKGVPLFNSNLNKFEDNLQSYHAEKSS